MAEMATNVDGTQKDVVGGYINIGGVWKSFVPQPIYQSKVISPSTSQQVITPDSGYDGLSSVTVNAMKLQSKSVSPTTSSQTVKPDSGYDGLSQVTVGAGALAGTWTFTPASDAQSATLTFDKNVKGTQIILLRTSGVDIMKMVIAADGTIKAYDCNTSNQYYPKWQSGTGSFPGCNSNGYSSYTWTNNKTVKFTITNTNYSYSSGTACSGVYCPNS